MTGMATPRGLAHPAPSGASVSPLGNTSSVLLGMVDRAERNSSFARAGARRRPRAWAAPIARPAARIAVAGGLTLAGWLLGAALSQANAATDDHVDHPISSAHDTEPEHRYAGTATSGTLTWAMPGAATGAKRANLHRFHVSAKDFEPDVSFRPTTVAGSDPGTQNPGHHASRPAPAAKVTKPAKPKSPVKPKHHAPASDPAPEAATQPGLLSSIEPEPGILSTASHEPRQGLLDGLLGGSDRDSGPGLLDGLLGSPEHDQPGLLDSVLGTVDDTVDTTLHTTVTSVDTVIDTAPVRVVEPPVRAVEPAPVASGSVSASVPATKLAKEPDAPVAEKVSKQAPAVVHTAPARVLTGQPAAKQETQPAPPVKERSRAGGGSSGGGEGLPSAPAAPAAPASTVSAGHDGSGGLRQLFALAGDGDTVTQLKLIGVSRDHEVDGAGRDAALPTTSPD
ncbi:hypothetical protein ACFORO_35055 [Amycolatopsis halotolerans]|uniref:Uncharacterized protein n=1 Tax=Amycolatopsis halotolerans TaxID=330083 RepID=A0ABV7QQ60_9PSEU